MTEKRVVESLIWFNKIVNVNLSTEVKDPDQIVFDRDRTEFYSRFFSFIINKFTYTESNYKLFNNREYLSEMVKMVTNPFSFADRFVSLKTFINVGPPHQIIFLDQGAEILSTTSSLTLDFLEDAFCGTNKLALECLVRLYTTVHHNYSFEEVKRAIAFDDIYDTGNLLMINVHHAIVLVLRRPDIATLKLEDNLKNFFKMFSVESRVNQILDINSIYLTETLIRERSRVVDRRIVLLDVINTEGRLFVKGFANYILDLDFELSHFSEYPDRKQFFLNDLIEEKLFEQMLLLEATPVNPEDDFLDSIFFWEFYEGHVDSMDYLILKFIMILRLYRETIDLLRDIVDMTKLSFKDITPKTVFKIIQDNMVKIVIKIHRTIENNKFEPFVKVLRTNSPATVKYCIGLLTDIYSSIRRLCEETVFLSAIIFFCNREKIDFTLSKVLTTSIINKIEPQKAKYHKDNLEWIDLEIKKYKNLHTL